MDDLPRDCSGADIDMAREMAGVPPPGLRGHVPKPHDGSHVYYKNYIETAIATDAPPSLELIHNNKMLGLWEAYLGIGKVSSFPVVLHMAITDICNARCKFCSYAPETSSARVLKASDIARADWLKFVERFFPNSALGEPLVHPQIASILSEVRRLAPFIKIGITTNASLMNDAVLTAIVGHLSVMAVSMNAARKETYERDMAPLKWETTLGNLRRLADLKKALNTNKPEVHASVVVHKHNIDELPELPAVLASVGIDRLRILVMSIPKPIQSRRLYNADDLIHHDPRRANRCFEQLRNECATHGVTLVFELPVLAEN